MKVKEVEWDLGEHAYRVWFEDKGTTWYMYLHTPASTELVHRFVDSVIEAAKQRVVQRFG